MWTLNISFEIEALRKQQRVSEKCLIITFIVLLYPINQTECASVERHIHRWRETTLGFLHTLNESKYTSLPCFECVLFNICLWEKAKKKLPCTIRVDWTDNYTVVTTSTLYSSVESMHFSWVRGHLSSSRCLNIYHRKTAGNKFLSMIRDWDRDKTKCGNNCCRMKSSRRKT